MKTLLRGWFFRIFAALAILGIGIFNIVANLVQSGAPFIFRALPASLPYTNLLVLNLGQAIVAVFLASEFLKQDKKNDTVEVIYARSMTNAEYILGKSFGILLVFFFLNILLLAVGTGFSFLSGDSSKGVLEYLVYPVLISLPTLVFILGLSFFVMITTKNQAITFILILGYIAVSVFYLDKKFYQVFDYIAYQIPMMNSTIAGFGDLHEVLIHRAIYFFIGLSLMFFTISRLDRLPQSKRFTWLPILLSVIFLSIGAYSAYVFIHNKQSVIDFKKQMVNRNNQYLNYPKVNVDTCNIEISHHGKTITAKTKLYVSNTSDKNIDTIILSLNPSLAVTSLSVNKQNSDFEREEQIIKIPYRVNHNQSAVIDISYSGTINENTCFLDQNLDDFKDNFSFMIFRIKKRYAYLQNNYVLLTREALWYPISGVGYSTIAPASYHPDFTIFNTKVHTQDGLYAISQGKLSLPENGEYNYTTEQPMPQISLLIGDYIQYTVNVDSVDYTIFTIDGNDYYKEYFTELSDSIPVVISDLRNEYETELGLKYPYNRFSLAEVPIQFCLDKHIWSLTSDAIQPEIVFYTEKGVLIEETDFKKRKRNTERSMKRNKEEVTPFELQSRIFKRFVHGNFMAPHSEWYSFDDMDRNTLSIFPNFVTFSTTIDSEKWPVINLAMQNYMKERYINPTNSNRWFFTDLSNDEKINLELRDKTLSDFALTPEKPADNDKISYYDIILAKGDYLFSVLRAHYGDAKFNAFMDSLINTNKFNNLSLYEFNTAVTHHFGESVLPRIDSWYNEKSLPGFLVSDLETYKVVVDEHTKYQIRFKVSNPENTDGIVSVNIDLYDPNDRENNRDTPPDFTRKIFLKANSAKEIGLVFATEPERMNIFTHISRNLPNNLIYDFGSFNDIRKTAVMDEIIDIKAFDNLVSDNEIVVDNEDSLFSYNQKDTKSYIKKWIDKNREAGYEYEGIRFWNPPLEWKPVLRSGFYGKYVRSAYYTRSGIDGRVAVWRAPHAEAGYYDVYCHIEKIHINRWNRREQKKSDYNFNVYHQGGVENIHLTDGDVDNGWNYLGTFFITPQTARIELTNESVGSMVFADAVKWVKSE